MPRYIDADALLDEIQPGKIISSNSVRYKIITAPTADVQKVKHSKWIHGREVSRYYENGTLISVQYENWKCGNCNYMISDHFFSQISYKYCPICGAEMDEKEEEKENAELD